MQSKENSSSNNDPKSASEGKNPWQKMADEVLADNCGQQGSVSDFNNEHETSSETTEEDSTIVAEKTGDKDIKFPDIEVDWNDRSDFWNKHDIMLEWLADVVNEDGSWKYDNVTIPKEWQKYVNQQLEARKRMYEECKEERNKTIEWIKTSKNIDINLEDEYGIGRYFSELPEEQKNPIRHDKDIIVESLSPSIEKTNSMERIESLSGLAKETFETFMLNYGNTITDSTVEIITKHMQIIANVAYDDYPDDGEIRADHDEYTENDKGFSGEIRKRKSDLSTAIEVANFSGDDRIIDTYMDTITKHPLLGRYAEVHPIDNRRVEAYIENVVPLIDKKDVEVQQLWDNPTMIGGFASVFLKGDRFGASDFCIHALTSEINPTTIQELLLARRDVSADDYTTYEQNRNDAYELQGTIISYRGFIHREAPGEHEILASMLKFYETKDNPEEHAKAEAELHAIHEKYSDYTLGDEMFDLKNYEKEEEQRKINGFPTGKKEKVVDALRRLVENTDPKILEKPKVEDAQLNDLIQNMHLDINKQSGKVYVDFKEVGKVVKRMNELLKEHQGKTGIKPSEIKVIAFIERVSTFAMRGISKKDRSELPFDSDFKEMCRFAELTSQSNKYDEVDFENFWNRFSRIKDFEDEAELMSHYQMLSSRRLAQLRNLPEKTPFLKKNADALWSGNLNDELLRLVDKR